MLFINGAAGAAKVVKQLTERDTAGAIIVQTASGVGLVRASRGTLQ